MSVNPVARFFSAIPKVIGAAIAYALHPRTLKLNKEQAEYVQELFLGGAMPEEIGRAMNTQYNRQSWTYFQVFDPLTFRYKWPVADDDGAGRIDFEIDGLEYINAALLVLGGIVKGYYNPKHPMVKKIADYAGRQEPPKRKGAK